MRVGDHAGGATHTHTNKELTMNINLLNRYFGAALYHQVHVTDPTAGAARTRDRSPSRVGTLHRDTAVTRGGAAN